MKKAVLAFIFFLIGLMFVMAACAKKDAETEVPWEDRFTHESAESVCVGIQVGEEGYYSLWADTTLTYFDGQLTEAELTNLTLLAFQSSENWNGGYYVYDLTQIEKIIYVLRLYDDPALQKIADELEQGLLMTQAST